MNVGPAWLRVALALNFFGSLMLFLSFQATSSNFRLITTTDGRSALCVEKAALIIREPAGGFSMGNMTCPEWEHSRPAAVVNVERPWMVFVGFAFTLIGFFMQFMGIEKRKSVAQLRQEIKIRTLEDRDYVK